MELLETMENVTRYIFKLHVCWVNWIGSNLNAEPSRKTNLLQQLAAVKQAGYEKGVKEGREVQRAVDYIALNETYGFGGTMLAKVEAAVLDRAAQLKTDQHFQLREC